MKIKLLLSVGLAILPCLTLSGAAQAGVDTNFPPVTSVTKSAGTRVAGTHSSDTKVPPISAQVALARVWQQSIRTPPEGPESATTQNLARQSLAATEVIDNALPVIGGANGTVNSLAGRPVLVCSPLHTCIIELPEGVQPVTTVGISKAEWNVQQAMVGKQPEIFLSPKFKGLHQNIVVAATDHGRPINYEIRLVSDAVRYVPALKIEDSGGDVRSWKTALQAAALSAEAPAELGNTLDGGSIADPKGKAPRVLPLPNIRLNHINLRWSIHCGSDGWFSSSDCRPIRPLRIYDDGTHTFIDMPPGLANHGGFPILQAKNASGHLIGVNTQIRGNTYVVDSVPPEIQLRLGSEVVTIRKKES
jgi:type IV secretion system protein VirB9